MQLQKAKSILQNCRRYELFYQVRLQKLLVLSGLTKESLDRWIYPEEYKPDYYIDSLKDIHDLLLSLNQH
jgi:hypothetical protein